MNEVYGKLFILNGETEPSGLFDNSIVYEGESVYEVIRLVKGAPLFFGDHISRLENSVRLQGRKMLAGIADIRKDILTLTRADRINESNLKIIFNYKEEKTNYLIYRIKPGYPSAEQYEKGVKAALFHAERKDPGSKVIDHRLRTEISHKLLRDSAYEAILVNENGLITEGSRSNIFFLKRDILYTAPENMILSGITRKHILGICSENNIKVKLECVSVRDMYTYDSVFMTGTSPMLLPFNLVDNISFNVLHPMMKHLRELYLQRVEDNLMSFRNEL
jgi:branched-chain amino acid aminotransferase